MKKLYIILLALLLCFQNITAFAVGDGNIDGGGGGMGSGTSSNYWNPGDDGVRVTIIRSSDNTAVSGSVDFTNITPRKNPYHFGKYSKLAYRNGKVLTLEGAAFVSYKPQTAMPRIVSSGSGASNIAAVKRYFCSEKVVKMIAKATGFDYDTLITGNYKLLIEPMAYFVYGGNYFAMTAHEAALYDQEVSGRLRAKMASMTHKNLPFAIFLERADLGYPAWTGSTKSNVSNATIIANLGLGVVKFTEGDTGFTDETYDYTYRTDTDVITAITVNTNTEYNADNPLTVTFTVSGKRYKVNNIVIPKDESQLVWFKWHTPNTPQTITINANVGGSTRTVTANIVNLIDSEPPDPTANDRNDGFVRPSLPGISQTNSLSWGVWSAKWHEYWVWVSDWRWTGTRWVDRGNWVDKGWYDFSWNKYSAEITSGQNSTPSSKAPTAFGKKMKSGYGFNIKVTSEVSTNGLSSSITQAQNAVTYFPEFKYQTYFRVLDRTVRSASASFEFKPNRYSTYNSRSHFTPIWYPDGNYVPYTQVYDAWTPAGMLTANLSDAIIIQSNLFADWHAAPKN